MIRDEAISKLTSKKEFEEWCNDTADSIADVDEAFVEALGLAISDMLFLSHWTENPVCPKCGSSLTIFPNGHAFCSKPTCKALLQVESKTLYRLEVRKT